MSEKIEKGQSGAVNVSGMVEAAQEAHSGLARAAQKAAADLTQAAALERQKAALKAAQAAALERRWRRSRPIWQARSTTSEDMQNL
jgi:NAD(P)H-hydrate repair Nnr-like enzyme with NAD(P)H-hydrate dehydratase domain